MFDAVSGSALKGANVVVNIGGDKYNVRITSSGEGRLSLADLGYGTYDTTLIYKGNAKYNPANVNLNVVVKDAVSLSAVYDTSTKELIVGLVNASSGSALKGANVVVNINDVNYNVKITSTGQGKLSLADLSVGTYTATAFYKGNAKYYSANTTADIVVKDEVNLSAVWDASTKELVVSLIDAVSGSALKGANVVVNIGGDKYNVRIASSGQGRLSLADLDYGTYAATLSYKGNAKYNAANVDLDIVVKDEVNLSAVYDAGADELTVTLVDAGTGSPLKGANVVVKIDGASYNVKIASNGQGKLSLVDLAPGIFLADISYKGNVKYCTQSIQAIIDKN